MEMDFLCINSASRAYLHILYLAFFLLFIEIFMCNANNSQPRVLTNSVQLFNNILELSNNILIFPIRNPHSNLQKKKKKKS